RPGDVLLAITTSGASPNVLAALGAARRGGLGTIALTGALADPATPGGLAADVIVAVPSRVTALVQEVHLALEHILCDLVEGTLFGAPA
ncbi:MAG TPA: SIS domain-containing protein, partial [Polyangia bacterium]